MKGANPTEETTGPVASTVLTAARILEYIGEHGRVYPRTVASDLDLNRSTVHRMLYTLELLTYVGKLPDGGYRLTFHLFEIGNSVPHSHNLIDTARRELLQLSHDTGLTVNHGILYDDQVLYVDKATPATYLQLDRSVGESEPLYCTSVGKVLLGYCDREYRESIVARLDLSPHTPNTITDRTALHAELEQVRTQGYAVDHQELSMEVRCVAAPVLDRRGYAVSGVSISGPEDKLTLDMIPRILPRLQEATDSISRNMSGLTAPVS